MLPAATYNSPFTPTNFPVYYVELSGTSSSVNIPNRAVKELWVHAVGLWATLMSDLNESPLLDGVTDAFKAMKNSDYKDHPLYAELKQSKRLQLWFLHYARGLYEMSRVYYSKQYPFGMTYIDMLHLFGEHTRKLYVAVSEEPMVIKAAWMYPYPATPQKVDSFVDNVIQFRERLYADYKDFWVFKNGYSGWTQELLDNNKKEEIKKHKAGTKN